MSSKISATTKILRKVLIGLWLAVIVVCIGYYLANPSAFTAENIAAFLERFQGAIWLVYLIFSILRGITLLPSTPLVLAGTMLFPGQPWAVLGVSMTGILLSSTMIYYFSDFLGFDEYFESKNPDLSHKIKAKLEHPLGFLFVAGWAFFPLVPTDLVCYLAGTTRMKFPKFITAVGVGEVILCSFYIFFGGAFVNYMR
ncbi:MAG: VTT domain-containing protein [Pyrinomonadaceae bacterium]|nr:TVP38/TMEM64 family protein [Pyrinomonadaceae bacterium]